VFAATCFTGGRNPNVSDARLMCSTARSLLDHATLAIDRMRSDVVEGAHGKHYTKYPLLTVIQCMPALKLRDAVHALAPRDAALEAWALGVVPHAISATLAVGMLRLGLALGANVASAIWLALIALFSTPLWPAGRTLYSENLQAALVVWITFMALQARQANRPAAFLWAGLLCALAINTKIVLCVMPLAILVDQCHAPWNRGRIAHLALLALPAASLGVVAWLTYNKLRFGDVLEQGYGAHRDAALGFSVPLASGVYGLLFSSGKSIFLYAPVLLASLVAMPSWFRSRRRDLWLIAIPTLFTLAVSACWWSWSGDWAWGPRLLLPIVPLACLPLIDALTSASKAQRVAVGVLALSGLYVQLLAVSVDPAHFLQVVRPVSKSVAGPELDSIELRDDLLATHFVPELNPIVGQQWLLTRYVQQPAWNDASYYPWRSLGIRSWRPRGNPTPEHLDFWLDEHASRAAVLLEIALGVSTLALGMSLLHHVRRIRHPGGTPHA
jgi:hypothetical protein